MFLDSGPILTWFCGDVMVSTARSFCMPLPATEPYVLVFYPNCVSPLSPYLTPAFTLFLLSLFLVLCDLMRTCSVFE